MATQGINTMALLAPDLVEQQQALSYKQKMADALLQQGLNADQNTQSVGGVAIKRSPLEGLSSLAKMLAGSYMQKDAQKENSELSRQQTERLVSYLTGQPPSGKNESFVNQIAPGFSEKQQEINQKPLGFGESALDQSGNATQRQPEISLPQQQFPKQTSNAFNLANVLRGNAAEALGGTHAGAAYWKQFEAPEMQRVDNYLGVSPTQSRGLELAKRMKEGTQTIGEGTDLVRVTPEGKAVGMYENPKLDPGFAAYRDKDGRVVGAGVLPGYTGGVANIAGSKAGAEARATAPYTFERSLGEGSAKGLLDTREKANAANDDLISINEARNTIKGGAYLGTGAETKLAIVKFASSLGVNIDPEKAGNTDYLSSTLGKGVLDRAKALGANPTDADARRIEGIVGTIGKDPKALEKILDFREEMAHRSIEKHNRDVSAASSSGARLPYDLSVKKYTPQKKADNKETVQQSTFNSLPDPAQLTGRRIKAKDGSILRSNGTQWVKE